MENVSLSFMKLLKKDGKLQKACEALEGSGLS
jgi:hypothetical protein